MNRALVKRAFLYCLFVVAGIAFAALDAHAQATRTWVSGVGDDANPCSRTAPCKTFAGAISKTATGGEINCLDPGGFGAVTITKPITIDCRGTFGSILAAATNGVIISIVEATFPSAVVTLRNLTINGVSQSGAAGLDGIRFIQGGAALHVENCVIFGFNGQGIDFVPTSDADLFVRDTQISEANGGGILIQPGASAGVRGSLYNVRLDLNGVAGLQLHDRSLVTAYNVTASRNNGFGFRVVSASTVADLIMRESVADGNVSVGVSASGANAGIRITDVLTVNNGQGMTGNVASWGNNYNTNNSVNNAPLSNLPLQ